MKSVSSVPFVYLIESIADFNFPISFFGILMWTSLFVHFLSLHLILLKMFYSFNFCLNFINASSDSSVPIALFFICTFFGESFHSFCLSYIRKKMDNWMLDWKTFTIYPKKRVHDLWMPFIKASTLTIFFLIKSSILLYVNLQ